MNQLINGRLNITKSELKILYSNLQKEGSRIKNKLYRNEKSIKDSNFFRRAEFNIAN